MSSSDLSPLLAGLQEANRRNIDLNLVTSLVKELSEMGYCFSRLSETWRVINRPSCPIKVQMEVRDEKEAKVDIIPLSAYTETLNHVYPLASLDLPHATTLPLKDATDIPLIVEHITKCFPKR